MRLVSGILCAAALSLLVGGRAAAEPVTLRFATVAPEGTGWAREFKAFARDAEALSNGQVRVKWYFSGIAGDESAVPERIRRGQIDGEAAAVTCTSIAPSLRVMRVVGMFRRREETHAVIARLRAQLDVEFRKAGYVALAITWFGSDVAFSRAPIRSMEDLQRTRLWIWNLDPVWTAEMKTLGVPVVSLPIEDAGRAYDEGRIDGFLALPSAALAYQWSARTHYVSNLAIASLPACVVVSSAVFESLPFESQAALRAAAAKATLRFEDLNGAQEDALLGGLFERQGTHLVEASPIFRAAFLASARMARESLPDAVVPKALITQVLGWLSDFRAERR
ncbi:MAG: C4-dicarboxylate transporter [bacterium]|nr:C4-dicarboxylate transporter [bacterium]